MKRNDEKIITNFRFGLMRRFFVRTSPGPFFGALFKRQKKDKSTQKVPEMTKKVCV